MCIKEVNNTHSLYHTHGSSSSVMYNSIELSCDQLIDCKPTRSH